MKKTVIKSVYDFQTLMGPEVDAVLEADIDFGGKYLSPIGLLSAPFTGSFDGKGHTISGVGINTTKRDFVGLFGVNKGSIRSLKLADFRLTGQTQNCCAGAICGSNYGSICDVHVVSGSVNIRAAAGETIFGNLCGENYGELRNVDASLDVSAITTGGSLLAGGFVGRGKGGIIETAEVSGEFTFTGKNIKAGTVAGELETCTVRACRFSSEMNLLNEELYTKPFGEEKNRSAVIFDGFLWRDNKNDDRFLPDDIARMRDRIVRESYRFSTIEWRDDRRVEFKNTNRAEVHHQIFEAGSEQHGPLYTHSFKSLRSFEEALDENGKIRTWLPNWGHDGLDIYIGDDCSANTYWAWSTVANDISFRVTGHMRPNDGCGCIAVPPCDGTLGEDTRQIMTANGDDIMAESMANAHRGDAINANKPGMGHTRVVTRSSVVYRDINGRIDFNQSYMITTEQGNGLYFKYTGQYPSYSWLTDYHYTFLELLRDNYMPLTTRVISSGVIPEEEVTYKSSAKGDGVIYTGTVKSNCRIDKTEAKVFDKDGNVIWAKGIYAALRAYAHDTDQVVSRSTFKEIDLAGYKPLWNPERIPAGKYTYALDVILASHNVHRVCEKSFTIGKEKA